jgi:hypothetical protein
MKELFELAAAVFMGLEGWVIKLLNLLELIATLFATVFVNRQLALLN